MEYKLVEMAGAIDETASHLNEAARNGWRIILHLEDEGIFLLSRDDERQEARATGEERQTEGILKLVEAISGYMTFMMERAAKSDVAVQYWQEKANHWEDQATELSRKYETGE